MKDRPVIEMFVWFTYFDGRWEAWINKSPDTNFRGDGPYRLLIPVPVLDALPTVEAQVEKKSDD